MINTLFPLMLSRISYHERFHLASVVNSKIGNLFLSVYMCKLLRSQDDKLILDKTMLTPVISFFLLVASRNSSAGSRGCAHSERIVIPVGHSALAAREQCGSGGRARWRVGPGGTARAVRAQGIVEVFGVREVRVLLKGA